LKPGGNFFVFAEIAALGRIGKQEETGIMK
jgi:hypothetical protein